MKNTIRNLFFVGLMMFAISYDSCTAGVDYDTKHKLYPECDFSNCYFSAMSYGGRWERLGAMTFLLGATLTTMCLIHWRMKEAEEHNLSILVQEE